MSEQLESRDILLVRAPNPGPLTLSGTNTWVVGRDPAWVIDPGPELDTHREHLLSAIESRGGLGGVALTHGHGDHAAGVAALRARLPAPLAAGRAGEQVTLTLTDGARFGPLEAVFVPGHAPDHFALIGHGACFSGDAVLGEGSVFIAPHPGALSGYLQALERLRLRTDFEVLCPGHGPPVLDAHAKIEEYLAHRLDRHRRVIAALSEGRRSVAELLDAAWPEVPQGLRPFASVTLAAHLDKLEDDRALPAGVERPTVPHEER